MVDAKMLPDGPHVEMAKEFELAQIYARDGAFRTAASVLRRLADRIDEHIDAVEISHFGGVQTRPNAAETVDGVDHREFPV